MAQPKPKKKRRSRSDPARKEAAARRDEARRQAAEERRLAEAAAERRKKLRRRLRRLIAPTAIGIGVVVAAIFVFRPLPEVTGVEKVAVGQIMADLGYPLTEAPAPDALPTPACRVFTEAITPAEQVYADLYFGAVILWHRPGDQTTAAALATLAADYESHVVVAPNEVVTDGVLATGWERRLAYPDADDAGLKKFVDTYRQRGAAKADCPQG